MIRFIYSYLKPVALFLAITFLFQCCKIYHKQSVTVEQAISAEEKVKVIFVDGGKAYFDDFYFKNDSLLHGLFTKKKSVTIKTVIPKKEIKEHISNVDIYGSTSAEIITTDGKRYFFDSFYYENDTLYGQKKEKRTELLIPIQSIKEIHLLNKDASEMVTVLLVVGCVIAVCIPTGYWIVNWYRDMRDSYNQPP